MGTKLCVAIGYLGGFVFCSPISFFTFFTRSIFASTLNLDTRSSVIKTGDSFVLKINLDTENKSVNTLEGDLVYDASVIVPQKVLVNESFVSFWIA